MRAITLLSVLGIACLINAADGRGLVNTSVGSGESCSHVAHMFLHLVEMAVSGALTDEAGRCHMAEGCPLDQLQPYDPVQRLQGRDWPPFGHTMVGLLRLRNIKQLLKDVVRNKIPGGFAELGVWRGGSCILAKAVLDVMHQFDRRVLVFDAFDSIEGYGKGTSFLATSIETVKHNFEKYGLLDDRVEFFKGYFKDSLPAFRKEQPSTQIAVLRIDGNFYDSHQDALYYMYDMVPVGGYVIFDDIRHMPAAARAWEDFRKDQNFDETLIEIDQFSAYLKKTKHVITDMSKMRPPQDCNKP